MSCFLHVSRGSAWTLPSPDFLRPWKRTQGQGSRKHVDVAASHLQDARTDGASWELRRWPECLKLITFFSPVSAITLEAFSRALQGLLALWLPLPVPAAPHAELPAEQPAVSMETVPARRGAGRGRCQVEQRTLTATPRPPEVLGTDTSATGTGRRGNDRTENKLRWERDF